MTVKRVITTKAIAAPSGCFLSVWIRIEQHSSLRKLRYKQALAAAGSNSVPAMHEAQQRVRCAAPARSNSYPSIKDRNHCLTRSWIVGIPVPDVLGRPVAENAALRFHRSGKGSGSNPEPKCKFNGFPQSRSYVDVVARRRPGNLPRVAARLANHLQPDDWIWSAAGVQF